MSRLGCISASASSVEMTIVVPVRTKSIGVPTSVIVARMPIHVRVAKWAFCSHSRIKNLSHHGQRRGSHRHMLTRLRCIITRHRIHINLGIVTLERGGILGLCGLMRTVYHNGTLRRWRALGYWYRYRSRRRMWRSPYILVMIWHMWCGGIDLVAGS